MHMCSKCITCAYVTVSLTATNKGKMWLF